MRIKAACSILLVFFLVAPLQAEWFDTGKAAYLTPEGKWRKAAIQVESNKVEVYSRKDRQMVAKFEKGEVEHGTLGQRRTNTAGSLVISVLTVIGVSWALAKQQEGEVDAKQGANAKWLLTVLAAVAVIHTGVGFTKKKVPYSKVADGVRSVRMRVSKKDQLRFEESLDEFMETEAVDP